jgi:hypothetical protein
VAYSAAVGSLSAEWDRFRGNFDAFRTDEVRLESDVVVFRLSQLVEEIGGIVVLVRELPASDLGREVTSILGKAAEAEDLALRKLRSSFGRVESGQEAQPDDDSTSTVSTFASRDLTLFGAFDTQLAMSNALRRHASQVLAAILEATSAESAAAVDRFDGEYTSLLAGWDAFRDSYDEWRRTDGGCDGTVVTERLGEFSSRFAALTRRTRELPGGASLGSLREIFVEAAEYEEQGLGDLRRGWRPFDLEVYRDLEPRRNTAASLLRQIAIGLDELLARFDLTLTE